MTTNVRKNKIITGVFVAVLIVLLLVMVALPLLWMVVSSFKPGEELFTIPPEILPQKWSLEWYIQAFQNKAVIHYCVNSLYIACVVMVIDMIVGSLTAYSLTRFRFSGRKAILVSVLAAYCVPPIMLMLPLYKIMNGLGQPFRRDHRTSDRHASVFRVAAGVVFQKAAQGDRRGGGHGRRQRVAGFCQDRSAPVHLRRAQHGDHGIYYVMERVFALQRADQ